MTLLGKLRKQKTPLGKSMRKSLWTCKTVLSIILSCRGIGSQGYLIELSWGYEDVAKVVVEAYCTVKLLFGGAKSFVDG